MVFIVAVTVGANLTAISTVLSYPLREIFVMGVKIQPMFRAPVDSFLQQFALSAGVENQLVATSLFTLEIPDD